jgi:hypothetical protein
MKEGKGGQEGSEVSLEPNKLEPNKLEPKNLEPLQP